MKTEQRLHLPLAIITLEPRAQSLTHSKNSTNTNYCDEAMFEVFRAECEKNESLSLGSSRETGSGTVSLLKLCSVDMIAIKL